MVERCELTLQSRLEPPTLTKDTSIDSTGTEDLTSASGGSNCTTQPMVHALIQPPPTVSAEAPLLLGTIFGSTAWKFNEFSIYHSDFT